MGLFDNRYVNTGATVLAIISLVVYLVATAHYWSEASSEASFANVMMALGCTLGVIFSLFLIVFFGLRVLFKESARDIFFENYNTQNKDLLREGYNRNPDTDPSDFKRLRRYFTQKAGNKLYTTDEDGRRVKVKREFNDLYKDDMGRTYRCEDQDCVPNDNPDFVNPRRQAAALKESRSGINESRGQPMVTNFSGAGYIRPTQATVPLDPIPGSNPIPIGGRQPFTLGF